MTSNVSKKVSRAEKKKKKKLSYLLPSAEERENGKICTYKVWRMEITYGIYIWYKIDDRR